MRAVIQRVNSASVSVDGARRGVITTGLVVLVGVTQNDGPDEAAYLAEKVLNMRLFPPAGSDTGFDLSALDVKAGILLVSQFTLYASTRKGRRPSFTGAAAGDLAGPLFDRVVEEFRKSGLQIETGVFGAHMHVELENDGPVTIVLDSDERFAPRG
ncbi:MAG: D-tyrosyl-tRNA(Tyr) deacylase [Chloroflexi bacterium]|nr:D-tyrosyl-tRNA(Tyr) deacylase [Chloroflexota bacterium]